MHHDKKFDRVISVSLRIFLCFPLAMILYGITNKMVFFWIGMVCISIVLLSEIWTMCYAITEMAKVSVLLTAVIVGILCVAFAFFIYPGSEYFTGDIEEQKTHEIYVYVTEYGEKYHKADCRYAENWAEKMTIESADEAGYVPCKVCNP